MATLDELSRSLATHDTKKKLQVGSDLITLLSEHGSERLECEELGALVDGLVPWMQSSNFRVSQNGLEIVALLVERLGHGFRPYVNTVIGAATDRLGDSRETVRERARELVQRIMEHTVEPQGRHGERDGRTHS